MHQIIQMLFRPLVNKFVLHKSSIFKIRSQQFTALNMISGLGVGIILKQREVLKIFPKNYSIDNVFSCSIFDSCLICNNLSVV